MPSAAGSAPRAIPFRSRRRVPTLEELDRKQLEREDLAMGSFHYRAHRGGTPLLIAGTSPFIACVSYHPTITFRASPTRGMRPRCRANHVLSPMVFYNKNIGTYLSIAPLRPSHGPSRSSPNGPLASMSNA